MRYGLSETDIKLIQDVFAGHSSLDKVILFGSRAKGNFKPGSDIDLALIGSNISFDEFLFLVNQLEELNLPFKIDLIDFKTIKDEAVLDHIKRIGVTFYELCD
jgi:uncharacterized protein